MTPATKTGPTVYAAMASQRRPRRTDRTEARQAQMSGRLPAHGGASDLTARDDYWFACLPASGTPPEVLRDQLLQVNGVTIYVSVGLPRPLPAMIGTWTRTHQHKDMNANLAALEKARGIHQEKRLTEYD